MSSQVFLSTSKSNIFLLAFLYDFLKTKSLWINIKLFWNFNSRRIETSALPDQFSVTCRTSFRQTIGHRRFGFEFGKFCQMVRTEFANRRRFQTVGLHRQAKSCDHHSLQVGEILKWLTIKNNLNFFTKNSIRRALLNSLNLTISMSM